MSDKAVTGENPSMILGDAAERRKEGMNGSLLFLLRRQSVAYIKQTQ